MGVMKMPVCLIFLVVVFAAVIETEAQTTVPPPREDAHFWHELQLTMPVRKTVDLNVFGAIRVGRGITRLVDERIGAGLAFKLNRRFTLQPRYFFVARQAFTGGTNYEHRLIVEGIVRFFPSKFTLTDRNRIERRFRLSREDAWIYRNRFQVEYPVRIGGSEFRPYVSSEIYYDTGPRAWTRHRLFIGFIKEFDKRVSGEFFYLRQNDGHSRPGDLHVIGTLLRIRLRE